MTGHEIKVIIGALFVLGLIVFVIIMASRAIAEHMTKVDEIHDKLCPRDEEEKEQDNG